MLYNKKQNAERESKDKLPSYAST